MRKISSMLITVAVFAFTAISCDNSDDISESIQSKNMEADEAAQYKSEKSDEKCATIQGGAIRDFDDEGFISLGFNEAGYNYQAQIYSGEMFPESDPGWYLEWRWNDAYLSTKDCDGDGYLDFPNGEESYRGTGAWTTTKWTKTYTDSEGNQCRVSQFTKFVAVPIDATSDETLYYDSDGTEIGQVVVDFEDFALVQMIWNDPCNGINGVDYKAPPVGLGNR